jgi:TolB-like protein
MKLKLIFIAVILLPIFAFSQSDYDKQIEYFSNDIVKKIPLGKKKIAIVDFKNNDNQVTQLTRLIAEDISAEMAIIVGSSSERKLEIVERNNLETIMKDLKISSTKDEAKIAKQLGARAITDLLITGIVTLFGDNYRITIKVLDSENGNVITASRGLVVKTSALEDLHKKVVDNSGETEKPVNVNQSTPAVSAKSKTSERSVNGWIEFENKSQYSMTIYVSSEQAVQTMTANNFEQLTMAANSKEKLPSLKPGIYYICVHNGVGYACLITKKVEVLSNEGTVVLLNP